MKISNHAVKWWFVIACIGFYTQQAIAAVVICQDEACFALRAADCKAATQYTTPEIAGAQVRYSILGSHKNFCDIDMVYTQHPNPNWMHKPLLFTIDADGDIDSQIKSAVAACLEGQGGKWLCDGPFYSKAGDAENPTAPVAASEPPCGVDVAEESPPLYPMPRNGQWGYVTRDGEWAIEPRWAYAEPFSEARAIVDNGGAWGVIDRRGNYVLEPILSSSVCETSSGNRHVCQSPMQTYSQGCSKANIQKDGSPHPFFVDRAGRFWLDDELPEQLGAKDVWDFGRFSGGRAWFQVMGDNLQESFGWIDAQGKVVLNDEFSGAGQFIDGRAPAASGGKYSWAYIDTDGNPVLPDRWKFNGARAFSEGLAAAEVKPYRWMYFNSEGSIQVENVTLTPPREVLGKTMNVAVFQAAGDFHNGLAPVFPAMMFDAEELIYVRPDGTEAFAPASKLGLTVCQASSLPEFRDGLVQLLVADEGAECGDARPGQATVEGENVHYIYVDTAGTIVLQETD